MIRLPDPFPPRAMLDLSLMDRPPEKPVYHVEGFIERGSVMLLAGDSGTAKSTIARDLFIATAQGRPWLGREVMQGPALYIHAEDGPRIAVRRLRAMGLRSTDAPMAHYWCRPPLLLSEAEHRDALRQQAEALRPSLMVLDSATMLSGIDINDNAGAAEFMGWVAALTVDLDMVTTVVHHEGKGGVGVNRSLATAAKAALGASQWRAQCDLHVAVELTKDPRGKPETTPDGVIDTWTVRLQSPKEREFGDGVGAEDVTVESLKRDGVLQWMRVKSRPSANADRPKLADRFVAAIAEAGRPLERKVCVELNGGKDNGSIGHALSDPRLQKVAGGWDLVAEQG